MPPEPSRETKLPSCLYSTVPEIRKYTYVRLVSHRKTSTNLNNSINSEKPMFARLLLIYYIENITCYKFRLLFSPLSCSFRELGAHSC